MNYDQTIQWLFKHLPMYQNQGMMAYKQGLDRIRALCEHLGNPQNSVRSIHLGGTNGKGSTAHMMASILREAGYSVGLFTSPHLVDFRERFRYNGKLIEKKFITEFINSNIELLNSISPSFFEMNTALGFSYFKEKRVDFAIIEVGLGGRLDSTNIISSPFLCIITHIGWDHTDVLGDSLEKIAREKAEIIKENRPVVIGHCSEEIKNIFREKAQKENSPIYFTSKLDPSELCEIPLKGAYQKINQHTALKAIEALADLGVDISQRQLQKGFKNVVKNTHLRGRWEIIKNNPKIILDTAHNEDGFKWIKQQLSREQFDRVHFVLGFVKGKDVKKLLSYLPYDASYYFSQIKVQRSFSLEELQETLTPQYKEAHFFSSSKKALISAISKANSKDLIFVGGSNFLVGELLKEIEGI